MAVKDGTITLDHDHPDGGGGGSIDSNLVDPPDGDTNLNDSVSDG